MSDDAASVSSRRSASPVHSERGASRERRRRKPQGDPKTSKRAFGSELITSGLSQIARTADGLRPAYLRLELTGTDLADASPLAHFIHLQTLVLSGNELADLSALSTLRNLTHLDVSGNKLQRVLGFEVQGDGLVANQSNLRVADFSHNQVQMLHDLSPFSRLQTLQLEHNQIEHVGTGLRGMSMLRSLSLAHNRLGTCKGLEGLVGLKELNLQGNCVRTLEPLSPLSSLEQLDASSNRLQHLRGSEHLASLRRLDVSYNDISSLHEVAHARTASLLSELLLHDNPVQKAMSMRLHVVHLLPQVCVLDGTPVAAKEKVLAANMHGADAEPLRLIRRKFFPNGELDDGGGAIPPPSAGLVASAAEEERADRNGIAQVPVPPPSARCSGATRPTLQDAFMRVDAFARSLRPFYATPGGGKPGASALGLLGLADQLASICDGQQILLARVCWQWVSSNVKPPSRIPGPDTTGSVLVPLFGEGPAAAEAEAQLLGGTSGTWAERVSWLFTQLCRACELEAVLIPGLWKDGSLAPGATLRAHNHCWASVKVNGRWRLVDCTAAAIYDPLHAPFFTPPDAFVYSYLPLEEQWQLLHDPLPHSTWWGLPHCDVPMFARGCRLLAPEALGAVNQLTSVRQGEVLQTLELRMAAPTAPGVLLHHTVHDVATGQVVCSWPPHELHTQPGEAQTCFQQWVWLPHPEEESKPCGKMELEFGAESTQAQVASLVSSLPGPGEYELCVSFTKEVPGGLSVRLQGQPQPLVMQLLEQEQVLRVRLVVPPVEPWDEASDGILHDAHNPRCVLPYTHTAFTHSRAQLVSPRPNIMLEADRTQEFAVVCPGARRVALASLPEHQPPPSTSRPSTAEAGVGEIFAELERNTEWAEAHAPAAAAACGAPVFVSNVQVPRVAMVQLVAQLGPLSDSSWTTLLTFQVLPQGQHIVYRHTELEVPSVDPTHPAASQAADMFRQLDLNADGAVTRAEMLAAFKRNRQLADLLRLPHRVRQHDGTLDAFVEGFLAIDNHKLGTFSFDELCAHLGVQTSREALSSSDDESWSSGSEGEGKGGGRSGTGSGSGRGQAEAGPGGGEAEAEEFSFSHGGGGGSR